MAFVFDAHNFALQLKEAPCEDGEFMLNDLLLSYDEKVREENKRLFEICHRVMLAEGLSDIDDISLEDIAACISVHDDYAQFYQKKFFAGDLFLKFKRNLRNVKTVRKRRVL